MEMEMNAMTEPTEIQAKAVVTLALQAGQGLAERLGAMKEALESGRDEDAMRIAREITKAKARRAA